MLTGSFLHKFCLLHLPCQDSSITALLSSNASALVIWAAIQPYIAQLLVMCAVQERDSVLAIVASVLHLGNIGFQQGDMDNAELLDEKSEDAMYIVSDLMQVSLLFAWFCYILRSCMLGNGRGDGDGAGGGGGRGADRDVCW